MDDKQKKAWLLKNWRVLNGKTISKALKRYWEKEVVLDRSGNIDDGFEIAKEIFK